MTTLRLFSIGIVLLSACGSTQSPARGARKPVTAEPKTSAKPREQAAVATAPERIEQDPDQVPKAVPPKPVRKPFALPNIKPPFERSARPGDGEWVRLGDPATFDRAAVGAPVFFETTLHPHPSSRFISVTIAAIDLQGVRLRYMPGADDVKTKLLVNDRKPGLVPSEEQAALLAVFNGGFKPAHGRWGMMLDGQVIVPARKEGCTVAILEDQSVRIEPWPELEARGAKLYAYRQTPPCLLMRGALHPQLAANNEKPWGGNVPNLVTRRRSAVGIDETRNILFYAYGEEAGAKLLAEGLRLVGAVFAAELDINWYWTRFLLFGQPKTESQLQVTSTLVPKMEHLRTGYVVQNSERDFFYLLRRSAQ